jgi:hypothetical protein
VVDGRQQSYEDWLTRFIFEKMIGYTRLVRTATFNIVVLYPSLHLYLWRNFHQESHGRGPENSAVLPPSAGEGHQLNSAASSGADVKYE